MRSCVKRPEVVLGLGTLGSLSSDREYFSEHTSGDDCNSDDFGWFQPELGL